MDALYQKGGPEVAAVTTPGPQPPRRGEDHQTAKLTEAQVSVVMLAMIATRSPPPFAFAHAVAASNCCVAP